MRRKLLRALPIGVCLKTMLVNDYSFIFLIQVTIILVVMVVMWMNRVSVVHPQYPVQWFNGSVVTNRMTDLVHLAYCHETWSQDKVDLNENEEVAHLCTISISIMFCVHRLALTWEIARDNVIKHSPELFMHPKKIILFPGLVSYLQPTLGGSS